MTPPTTDNPVDKVENQLGRQPPHSAFVAAVDALEALLTATARHVILQDLGDEWGKGIQALAAARAELGPRLAEGAIVLRLINQKIGTIETITKRFGAVETYALIFPRGRATVDRATLLSGKEYRLLTDTYEIAARTAGWRWNDQAKMVCGPDPHDHSGYLSWLECCVGEKLAVGA